MIEEHIVIEARALAASRLAMHRLGDKNPDEYRAQIEEDIDLLGGFLEDDERAAEVRALTQASKPDSDSWYEEYLKKNWAGHPEYVGAGEDRKEAGN